jgi:PAS domain S-box-containing protein
MKKPNSIESNEIYKILLENSLVGQVILQDGYIIYANPAMARITGYTVEELLSLSPDVLETMTHPDDRTWVLKRLRDRLAGKDIPKRYEFRFIRKDGQVRWVEITASLLEFNNHPAVQVTYMDVTEKVQMKQKLQENEARLRTVLYNAPITIFATDQHGIFTLNEGKALQKAGMQPGENVGKSAFDLFSSLSVIEHMGKTITGGDVLRRVLAGETLSGITELNDVIFDNHFSPIRDVEDQIIGMVGIATDITERKRGEMKIKESKYFLQNVLDTNPNIIFVITEDQKIILANRAFAEFYRTDVHYIEGKTQAEIHHELKMPADELKRWQSDNRRVIETGESLYFLEYGHPRDRDGVWYRTRKVPLVLQDGKKAVLVVSEDIDELKEKEKELYKQTELLQTILDHIPVMIAYINSEGRTEWVNKEWQRVLGWSLTAAQTSEPLEEMYPEPQERQKVLDFALQSSQIWKEFRTHTKDGEVLDTVWANVRLSTGEIIGIGYDNSERKKTEEQQAKLLAAEQKALKDADSLRTAMAVLTTSIELNEVLENILIGLEKVVGYDSAAVMVLEGEEIHVVAGKGFPVNQQVIGQRYEIVNNEIIRTIALTQQPLILTDAQADSRFQKWGGTDYTRGWMGVPMISKEKFLGYITLDSRQIAAYGQKQAEMAQAFANQAAVAIENARLYEKVRTGNKRMRALASYLQNAREEERTRIAREIHDEFGVLLTSLKFDLAWILKQLPGDQSLVDKGQEMKNSLDALIENVRQVATELRPGLLDSLGLTAAMEWQGQEFEKRTGIKFMLDFGSDDFSLGSDLDTALFRIFQETLTNVSRHAEATQVEVNIQRDQEKVSLTIQDNGKGITEKQISDPKSLGLIGMQERVNTWGGKFSIQGQAGHGTLVSVTIPISTERS